MTLTQKQMASLGGKARARKLSAERRSNIAKQAGTAGGNGRPAKWRVCQHDWGKWKTLYCTEIKNCYAAIRLCKACKAREFDDLRGHFKILPPEKNKS